MTELQTTHAQVREYYGQTLQSSRDLKTDACCSAESLPPAARAVLPELELEIIQKFYGCGSPIPQAIDGAAILDLGCGTGRDVYICAKLVGKSGRVIGIDMTDEQLEVARAHVDAHAERFGFSKPNTEFRSGQIEDLTSAGIEDNSIDIVISNCVLNLSPDKPATFREIFRVLKPGGELLFSDVFVDRRLDEASRKDPVLVGECLGGALYIEDFRRLLTQCNVPDYRVLNCRPLTLTDPEILHKVGPAKFHSMTIRAFKLTDLEDRCEDYGQFATYLGTIADAPHAFRLDDQHVFEAQRPVAVCGNTAAMLAETRFAPHFNVVGDRSRHFGVMVGCAPSSSLAPVATGGCC